MNLLKKLYLIGVKSGQDVFHVRLIKAINLLSINGVFCMFFAALYGTFLQHNATSYTILYTIPFFFFTIYLNYLQKVYWAATLLFVSNSVILTIYSFRTGEESYTHTLFILMIFALSIMYRRNEIRLYFFLNLTLILSCIIFVLVGFEMKWFTSIVDPSVNFTEQRQLNFIILLFCSLLFSMVVSITYQVQHKAMEMALNEHKVLLAEVNHRVKNNLAVIISLLNLQGYAEGDEKVSDALKEIRNRVMSMSLVHNKMYQNKDKNSILLDLYIRELVDEISTSINMQKKLNVDLDLANISINLSQAIPLGLILNELITNSMKHAFKGIEEPKIIVRLTVLNETDVELIYKDNGIGIDPGILELNGGLGLELMRSLSEQMDAISTFSNESGLTFKLTFAREGIA